MGLHIRGRTNHICRIRAKELGRARRRPINNSGVGASTLLEPFSTLRQRPGCAQPGRGSCQLVVVLLSFSLEAPTHMETWLF